MFTFPQVHTPKLKMSLVWKERVCVDLVPWLVCWYEMAYTLYVECLGETVCICLRIKPRFAFLLLMTVEKVKRMQGNLTLVVSWNVGENPAMEWGVVAWKSFRHPLREVKFKVDVFQRISHFLKCVLLMEYNTESTKKETEKSVHTNLLKISADAF